MPVSPAMADILSPPHPSFPRRQDGASAMADILYPPPPSGPRRHDGASAVADILSPPHPSGPRDRPPIPMFVLNSKVDTGGYQLHSNEYTGLLTDKPAGAGWSEIPCASRMAYGCGMNIQAAIKGLRLYARLGDGRLLTSSLAIRMTQDAFGRFKSELNTRIPGDLIPDAVVEMAEEQGLTVILLSLQNHLYYYLVYDAIHSSLSVFPALPHAYRGVSPVKPIVSKSTAGGGGYMLLRLRREDVSWPSEHVFSVAYPMSDGGLSKFKMMHFPRCGFPETFTADVAFSKDFWGFWGDLERGLVYCNLQTSDSGLDFGFVQLPSECKVDMERDGPRKLIRGTRTMGLVGDSIWFVSIDAISHYTNDVVSIWEMKLPEGQLKGKMKGGTWKKVQEVPAKVLWELSSFKEVGLPAAPIRYPILMAGGALCFVLVDQSIFPQHDCPLVDHFCSFDMHYKKLLWHGLVHNYEITDSVIMYPSSRFLQMKRVPSERTFAEVCGSSDTNSVSVNSQGAW